ncbi:MAG: hypothetical protein HY094_05600 [Candidatus Melainabacteria bacterium]|nr:hypothetical protein [Candidatus Melainabacteria bacterium]
MRIRQKTEVRPEETLFKLSDFTPSTRTNNKKIFKSVIEKAYGGAIRTLSGKKNYKPLREFVSHFGVLAEKNIIFESLITEPINVQLEALKKVYECLAMGHLRLALIEKNLSETLDYHGQKSRYYNSIFRTLIEISKEGIKKESTEGHSVALALWRARKAALEKNPLPMSNSQPTLFDQIRD